MSNLHYIIHLDGSPILSSWYESSKPLIKMEYFIHLCVSTMIRWKVLNSHNSLVNRFIFSNFNFKYFFGIYAVFERYDEGRGKWSWWWGKSQLITLFSFLLMFFSFNNLRQFCQIFSGITQKKIKLTFISATSLS